MTDEKTEKDDEVKKGNRIDCIKIPGLEGSSDLTLKATDREA